MTAQSVPQGLLAVAAALALTACATTPTEPSVRTVEVVVTKPVPCPALATLGPEPTYSDTDEAIRNAGNLAERALLYAKGRAERSQRLLEYASARAACTF